MIHSRQARRNGYDLSFRLRQRAHFADPSAGKIWWIGQNPILRDITTCLTNVFTEDASKLTLVAYDDQDRNAFVLSNGKAITVSLSRAHIRNAPQPSSSVRLVKNTAQYAGTILINGTQQLVYVIPVAVTPTAFVEIKSKRASTLILLVPTYAQHILLC